MQPNWIKQRAYLTPNRIGLRFGGESWTFQQLHEEALHKAKQLATLVKRGERVAIFAPSTPALVKVIYGCMHLQAEMVLLNGRLSAAELAYQIEDAQVAVVLVAASEMHKLPQNIKVVTFEQLAELDEAQVEIAGEWHEEQTISIMYTSGTTGFPKGVRQTVQNHSMSAISSALNLGVTEQDVWLCTVPIFHISGFSILMRSLLYGATVCLYEKFDAQACVREIAEGDVTNISLVSVMLERVLSEMERLQVQAHPRFKAALAGGGSIPVDYLQRAAKVQLPVVQTYGMTETSSQTATLTSADALRKIGSAGKPLFFNEIRISGTNQPFTEGEICIRGPHVTPGYIGRFAERVSTENGWLLTGDIGYVDDEGYLYVVDRRADLIISGGENVYPAEIENVLLAHPYVLEAGVCGVTDEKWGQVPLAFIVCKQAITEDELRAFCQQKLASYKLPKHFYCVASLPRNGSNKLLRRKLIELL
ncbi:o-succinylbenzoate--CoA ligase [Metasolibacillus meyeri]|uniref:2-succinylbenzoate--CoA ligase n=1 Tax=Metasolibacillus meyeri TaxID=1071052 RepID=A0AAW9NRY9_9BACL|nr:o-succinylbenzoate--CoA ligase [Metasolibacillus meyeri]MEC1180300.1 o-succinylbenzoate--CoA ligase [Metasolibacillus meyeri]